MSSIFHLVIGGSRSGKSAFAEKMALEQLLPVVYVATCLTDGMDVEMMERVEAHAFRRPKTWKTIENRLDLDSLITEFPMSCFLVDCLTLWLSGRMMQGASVDPSKWLQIRQALIQHGSRMIAVSNELGFGIVPASSEERAFRDLHGKMNQQVAALADRVDLIVAGIPMRLKG